MEKFDTKCLIIGGGIAGISIAARFSEFIEDIILIDQNNLLGNETSSRNSEVIHAGIYYESNSLKARLCLEGKNLLYEYLNARKIDFKKCGKYIVSTSSQENERLRDIKKQAEINGVEDLIFNHDGINEYSFLNYEDTLFSPSTGVFDSHTFLNSLNDSFTSRGGILLKGNKCLEIDPNHKKFEVKVRDLNNKETFIINTNFIVNAAGLESCNILNNLQEEDKYMPRFVKGEYYVYQGKEKLNHLIYPMPNKDSLGLHATIDLGNGIRFGPSAYDVNNISYEISEDTKNHFVSSIRKYWPKLQPEEIIPSYSGIRPLVSDKKDFIFDMSFWENNSILSILNYASPGLTSCLSMAKYCSSLVKDSVNFKSL